jgi:hypothetical protein
VDRTAALPVGFDREHGPGEVGIDFGAGALDGGHDRLQGDERERRRTAPAPPASSHP